MGLGQRKMGSGQCSRTILGRSFADLGSLIPVLMPK